MTLASLVTAEELFNSPERHKHCELVNGGIVTMSPTGGEHGVVTMRVTLRLGGFVEMHKLGECVAAETGFLLSRDPDTVRAPDFAFIPKERVPAEGISAKFLSVVPALVVEVLSPSDHAMDIADKISDWSRFGVDQVWIINPKLKTVAVHIAGLDPHTLRTGDTLTASFLSGFSLAIADLF